MNEFTNATGIEHVSLVDSSEIAESKRKKWVIFGVVLIVVMAIAFAIWEFGVIEKLVNIRSANIAEVGANLKDGLKVSGRQNGFDEEPPPFGEVYVISDIIINPVTFGGGLKIKNVEALCNGLPLVTTSVGAEGLEQGVGTAFHVCDTSDAMTETLCRLIGDAALRTRMSAQAHRCAREHFTEERAYGALAHALASAKRAGEANR